MKSKVCSTHCNIALDSSFLVTGGRPSGSSTRWKFVTEYSREGFVKEWPPLREARNWHGCERLGQVNISDSTMYHS